MSNEDQPYVVIEKRDSAVSAFLAGALLGAGIALLFAPKKGSELQEDLRTGARRLREGAEGRLTEWTGQLNETYGRARDGVQGQIRAVRAGMREGGGASDARADISSRLDDAKSATRASLSRTGTDESGDEAASKEGSEA